jgi:hypothetical protein
MLNSGKKIRALRDKKKYSNSRVVRKKNSERNKKTIPCKLNGRSLRYNYKIKVYHIKVNRNHITGDCMLSSTWYE